MTLSKHRAIAQMVRASPRRQVMVLALLVVGFLLVASRRSPGETLLARTVFEDPPANAEWARVEPKAPLPGLRFYHNASEDNAFVFRTSTERDVVGQIAEHLGLSRGVEIGVQRGIFAKETLRLWKRCSKYVLVDLWMPQENYLDVANKGQDAQDAIMESAMTNTQPWADKIETCRNYSETCATRYDDGFFDYAYIDARHDFKGVFSDLTAYFPKVRAGGFLAGHDYIDSPTAFRQSEQNWTVQFDGTVDHSRQAVKGAVNLFFALQGLHVTAVNADSRWPTWVAYKPLESEPRHANMAVHLADLSCFSAGCAAVSDATAERARLWERMNLGSVVLVWTAELVALTFPKAEKGLRALHEGDARRAEEAMLGLAVRRFGGVAVDRRAVPTRELRAGLRAATGRGGAFAFCAHGGRSCGEVGAAVWGGDKDAEAVQQVVRKLGEGVPLALALGGTKGVVVVQTGVGTPCSREEMREEGDDGRCMAVWGEEADEEKKN